jgi:outer membrane protein assembly factor BamD
LAVGLLLVGCRAKTQTVGPPPTAQELFDQGQQYLERKQYAKAVAAFQRITLEYAATRYAADAQFYLAEADLAEKDYVEAGIEYEFLTTNYPTSSFYEEAMYKTALCHFRQVPRVALDQSDARKTREMIELFRERFPNSRFLPEVEKLEGELESRAALKEYEAGMLYAKAGEYESAKTYFLYLLEQHPKASLVPETRFQLGICYEKTGNQDQAREIYQDLSTGSYEEPLKERAARRLAGMKQ